jgi:exodeoxyribonuclease-3
MSPSGPAQGYLRVATWNVNSLRARLVGVERLIERTRPDVLCLQETKTARLGEAAQSMFERLGYHVSHVGSGSYNGVAIATTAAQATSCPPATPATRPWIASRELLAA